LLVAHNRDVEASGDASGLIVGGVRDVGRCGDSAGKEEGGGEMVEVERILGAVVVVKLHKNVGIRVCKLHLHLYIYIFAAALLF